MGVWSHLRAFYVSTTLCLLYVILCVSTNTKHVIQLVSTNTKHVIQLKKYKLTDDDECACACWSFRAANIVKAGSESRTTTRAGPYDRTTMFWCRCSPLLRLAISVQHELYIWSCSRRQFTCHEIIFLLDV